MFPMINEAGVYRTERLWFDQSPIKVPIMKDK